MYAADAIAMKEFHLFSECEAFTDQMANATNVHELVDLNEISCMENISMRFNTAQAAASLDTETVQLLTDLESLIGGMCTKINDKIIYVYTLYIYYIVIHF